MSQIGRGEDFQRGHLRFQSNERLNEKSLFTLSFYPDNLVNDDIFEVMACHFAMSSAIQSMSKKMQKGQQLRVYRVVIPSFISSRYDVNLVFQPKITNIVQLLKLKPTKCGVIDECEPNLQNVSKLSQQMHKMISKLDDDGAISENIVIVFNRYGATNEKTNTICVLSFDDENKLEPLFQNYFLSFEFQVSRKEVLSEDDVSIVTRC